jgi:hypothetical protein
MIALSVYFDAWRGRDGGSITCHHCFGIDEDEHSDPCRNCDAQSVIRLPGRATEWIDGDAQDVLLATRTIVACAQGDFPRTPNEYLEQSSKWISAYEFLLPFVAAELEAERERKRQLSNGRQS